MKLQLSHYTLKEKISCIGSPIFFFFFFISILFGPPVQVPGLRQLFFYHHIAASPGIVLVANVFHRYKQ